MQASESLDQRRGELLTNGTKVAAMPGPIVEDEQKCSLTRV